jgi:hypothetical protein
MKLALGVSIVGLLAAQTASAQNLLSNPDLDTIAAGDQVLPTPVAGWHVASSKAVEGAFNDGASSETFCNVAQAGGTGLFFKAFQGVTGDHVWTSLYQDVAGTAGNSYSLTGWAGAGAAYIGLSDPTVGSQFALQFLNSSNSVIGTVTVDLKAGGLGTPNGNPFGYKQFTVSGVAPAGTTTVRSIARMMDAYNNPAGGDQAFVVDSFQLVPAPGSLAILGLGGLVAGRRRR